MTWRLRIVWLATAAVLVLITVVVPRLSSVQDRDPFPSRVSLDESKQLGQGSLTIKRVTAAPRWTDGEHSLSLEKDGGVFVEVRALAHPDREATFLRAVIRSKGRTYDYSDRLGSFNDQAEAGFDTGQIVTFEVPADVLDSGEIWMYFTEASAARIALPDADIRRIPVLEQQE